jgi:hypothetical protein
MYEYSHSYVKAMTRAYQGLAARNLDEFTKPLARGVVPSVLQELCRAFAIEVSDLSVIATDFSLNRSRLRVTGHLEATVRGEVVRLRAAFRHDWELAYGVAWRLTQHVGPAITCAPTAD